MANFASLVFYFLTFGTAIAAFSYYNSKSKIKAKMGLGIAVLVPTLVAGFRYMVGTDYKTYYAVFTQLTHYSYYWLLMDVRHLNIERGFLVISKSIIPIFGIKGTFGLYALLITFIFVVTIIKQYKNLNLTILFFLFLFGPNLSSYNILRQSIALVMLFWGEQFIFKGDFNKYIAVIILASLFHASSVLAVPIYFLWNHRKGIGLKSSKKIVLYIIMIILVSEWRLILAVLNNYVGDFFYISKYGRYLNIRDTNNRSFYLKLTLGLLFLLLERQYIKYDKRFALFINAYIIGIILEYTGFYTPFIKRISSYYSVYPELLLLGTLPFIFSRNLNRRILKMFVVTYEIILFLVTSFYMNQGWYFPYKIFQ